MKSDFKMALIWKRAIFDLLFTFSSHQGKVTKFLQHISNTYIHVFCSPYWLFGLNNFEKKKRIYQVRFLLVWVLVLILIRTILEQSINYKMVSKFKLECLLLIYTYTNKKFIVICKPWNLNDGDEDSVKYKLIPWIQKSQKVPLSTAS